MAPKINFFNIEPFTPHKNAPHIHLEDKNTFKMSGRSWQTVKKCGFGSNFKLLFYPKKGVFLGWSLWLNRSAIFRDIAKPFLMVIEGHKTFANHVSPPQNMRYWFDWKLIRAFSLKSSFYTDHLYGQFRESESSWNSDFFTFFDHLGL